MLLYMVTWIHQYTPNVSIYTSTMDPMGNGLQVVRVAVLWIGGIKSQWAIVHGLVRLVVIPVLVAWDKWESNGIDISPEWDGWAGGFRYSFNIVYSFQVFEWSFFHWLVASKGLTKPTFLASLCWPGKDSLHLQDLWDQELPHDL